MRIFLSYAKSHIYELHSILAATITFILMLFIKKPIKQSIRYYVERKAENNQRWAQNKKLYRKRCNSIIVFSTMLLAIIIFTIISFISPLIEFKWFSAILSGTVALTEYAIFDQIFARGSQDE